MAFGHLDSNAKSQLCMEERPGKSKLGRLRIASESILLNFGLIRSPNIGIELNIPSYAVR